MQLEVKHLTSYFPHKLRILKDGHILIVSELNLKPKGGYRVWITNEFKENRRYLNRKRLVGNGLRLKHVKPILHPLSDLKEEIEYCGEKIFVPKEQLMTEFSIKEFDWDLINTVVGINSLPYYAMEKLFEWHFDVYGLIDNGLAHDINKLNIYE